MQAATFLRDHVCADAAARGLAAAVRVPVRRHLTNLPSFIIPYLPATSPPPPNPDLAAALLDATSALSSLSHDDLSAVLHHLHPLELPYLTKALLHSALAPYSTSNALLDLCHPLASQPHQLSGTRGPTCPSASSTAPYWDGYCHRLLRLLADRGGDVPVATLALSHVNHITASYLRPLVHALRDLQLTSPARPVHVSFLRCATSLTRLGIVSHHTPQASLIGALLPLCHLRRLEVVLPKLTSSDTSQLRARPGALASGRLSSAVVNIFALSNSLSRVTHAHLRVPSTPITRDAAFWPVMLAHCLPIPELVELTCYPVRPQEQGFHDAGTPVLSPLGCDTLEHLTALNLSLPVTEPDGAELAAADDSSDSGDAYEIMRYRPVVRAVCAAADSAWPNLQRLSLDCHMCGKTDLRSIGFLTLLQGLTLVRMPARTAVSVSKSLSRLASLRELHIGASPSLDEDFPGDISLGIGGLRLTRLGLKDIPLSAGTLKMIARLQGLQELTWHVAAAADSDPDECTAEVEQAFVAMLMQCCALTALHMPFPVEPWEEPRAVAALGSLRQLRALAMVPLAYTGGNAGVGFDGGGWRVPPWVTSLRVDLEGGDADTLLCVLGSISAGSSRMTRLAIRCRGSLLIEEGCQGALAAALGHVPQLEELHLPGECLRGPHGREAVSRAIEQLTRLQQLALPGYKGDLDRLWRAVRYLPLSKGVSGVALPGANRS